MSSRSLVELGHLARNATGRGAALAHGSSIGRQQAAPANNPGLHHCPTRYNLFTPACDHVLGAARRVLRAIVFNRSLNVTVPARWPGSFWSLAPPTLWDPIERIGKKEFLFSVTAEQIGWLIPHVSDDGVTQPFYL
jgi:hypothetical protein